MLHRWSWQKESGDAKADEEVRRPRSNCFRVRPLWQVPTTRTENGWVAQTAAHRQKGKAAEASLMVSEFPHLYTGTITTTTSEDCDEDSVS
jgi:hypothetical protein